MISTNDLEKKITDRVNAIPIPVLSPDQLQKAQQKNRMLARENLDHTTKILTMHQEDAIEHNDTKKKMHTIVLSIDQKDQQQTF